MKRITTVMVWALMLVAALLVAFILTPSVRSMIISYARSDIGTEAETEPVDPIDHTQNVNYDVVASVDADETADEVFTGVGAPVIFGGDTTCQTVDVCW